MPRCRVPRPAPTLPPVGTSPRVARLEIAEQMLIWTSVNALRDAGYWERRSDLRVGLVMGVGGEWVLAWEDGMHRGDDRVFDPA